MNALKNFLSPLGIFIIGMVILLFVGVFYPAFETQTSASITQIGPTQMSSFTMLSWAMNSWPLLLFCGFILLVVIIAVVAWLRR
jgi:type II secretory pathway component PulF